MIENGKFKYGGQAFVAATSGRRDKNFPESDPSDGNSGWTIQEVDVEL